jgi:hypothetical protein
VRYEFAYFVGCVVRVPFMRTAAGTVVKMSIKGIECFPRHFQVRVYASDFPGE